MPGFSIIIPAHNEEKYLAKTLESIQQQEHTDYEVIVVLNGCTDGTEEVIKRYRTEKIRHLSLPNANVSVARNAGALNAQGTTLIFLDADTTLEPNALLTIKQQFSLADSVAVPQSKADLPGIKFALMMWLKNVVMKTGIYETCSGALICRKEQFHKVGGYDPSKKIREHRKLISTLRKEGNYKYINTTVSTSMRRYQQWSIFKVAGFWIKQLIQEKLGKSRQEYERIR